MGRRKNTAIRLVEVAIRFFEQIVRSGLYSVIDNVSAESVGLNVDQSLTAYDISAANNDGVELVEGNLVLLIGQTNLPDNGPYVVGAVSGGTAPLTRPSWFENGDSLPFQTKIDINGNGEMWPYKTFVIAGIVGGTIGTDPIICSPNMMTGKVTLTDGSAVVNLPAITLGASGGHSIPTATNTTSNNPIKAVITDGGGTLTLSGTGNDVIAWTVQNF